MSLRGGQLLVHDQQRNRLIGGLSALTGGKAVETTVVFDGADLLPHFAAVEAARGDVSLTYFEFTLLAIARLLAGLPLDLVILEVGMGGRLDAVNAFDNDCAVITSIDVDHVNDLGWTALLEAVILGDGVPVFGFSGEREELALLGSRTFPGGSPIPARAAGSGTARAF